MVIALAYVTERHDSTPLARTTAHDSTPIATAYVTERQDSTSITGCYQLHGQNGSAQMQTRVLAKNQTRTNKKRTQ